MESWGANNSVDEFERHWASVSYASQRVPLTPKDPIEEASDADLILELVKRGYAVGKLNENNQLEV